ncbi:cobalamin biosynthesis protein CobW [Methylocystis bryophila]|uniref:Cobalamin biosynthesis protein CobW n=1 Tax=Methylocystis bryophila TaxID=655015 RepID=A0A1W6MZD1_9HYPH|nr:cobalamin biosynthesis protein CobW [Methylocystis bryophila]ARN82896.1 cobalamin biosynthesis protein CobW [Methylocystis bryophila]BDV39173.1 cobalamin biosynthesis protein CobW [Methylocystis bryophila]
MSERIAATIVTGFLGAGKTTLIRHLVEATRDRRLALLINEFGDVGVDGEILRACGDEDCERPHIVELANGCLCCTVAEDFAPAIEALLALDSPPEHVIIETSGLALPKPLVKAFDWPRIRSRLFVDGVVAVVDGPAVAEGRFADDLEALARERADDASLDHDNPLEEVFEDQIACADIIVLNKTDLLDPQEEARVMEILRAGVGRASILRARHGVVDPRVALGLGATIQADLANRPTHHDAEEEHDHDDFESFVLDLAPADDPERLVALLSEVAAAHDVLRMKGFVEVTGKPMRLLVQGVGARFLHHYDRPWKIGEPRASRLVVIGRKGLDRAKVAQRLSGR